MPGGVAIQREITLDRLPGQLAAMGVDPRAVDWRPALADTSVYLGAEYKRSFAESRSPDGTPWRPLKRQRSRRRDRRAKGGSGQKPLRDTGLLMASSSGGAGFIKQLTALSLEQGTNVEYAGFQNNGTRFIPARPFVGVGPKQADMIERIVADRIERQLFGGTATAARRA
jgi:phage gpG-like protein